MRFLYTILASDQGKGQQNRLHLQGWSSFSEDKVTNRSRIEAITHNQRIDENIVIDDHVGLHRIVGMKLLIHEMIMKSQTPISSI